MKPKYIKFILPLILSSVVSALFGCSNKTPSNEDMIINKFNSLKNGNYTFTYTLNDKQYSDVYTKDYYYIGYLNTGSILLETISEVKYAYDFKITDSNFVLKGQSFNEEYTLQEQTSLPINKLKNINLTKEMLKVGKEDNKFVISNEEIVNSFSEQLDFTNIQYLYTYIDNNKNLNVDLIGFDPIEEVYYVVDAGHIVVTNINSSKLDLVDNFLKSYVKPTSNLVNKGDNIFTNVSFSSAIYDFILDDNMALLVKSTNLDIYNDFIKITDIDENNSQTSLTYKVQDDKETLKIVGVNGKNEIVNNETTKRYSDFNFVGKEGFELDKFAKINKSDEYYTYLGSNATALCYSITQDPQIVSWKIQDIKVIEENNNIVQFDFFTPIMQDKLTGKYFYRWINTKVHTANKIDEAIIKTPSKDDELIKKYLTKISSSDSIFKATETDYAWENNRKLEFIKGENFYLKQSLVSDGTDFNFEKEGEGYYLKNNKMYSFKYDQNNNVNNVKETTINDFSSIINFNLSSEVLYLENDKIKPYGDIIDIGSSLPFIDNPLTVDPRTVEFNIKNDTISSLNLSYYGGVEEVNFDYSTQYLNENLKDNIEKEISKLEGDDKPLDWSKYASDVVISGLIEAFGNDFAYSIPYLEDSEFLQSNAFDGWYNDYDGEPFYFIVIFTEKVDYDYSNKYKEYLLSLGFNESPTNSFVKNNIKIDIVNNEDSSEFLHIYKLD